jgi:hypothetical protein
MGGALSGYRWHKKRTVESCHALDTADLKRLGVLRPEGGATAGELKWMRGEERRSEVCYTFTPAGAAATLRLSYRTLKTDESIAYPIRLVTTPCHLGGVRWWFVCPLTRGGVACGRRVRVLYLSGRYFGCRHCHNLTYTSTQQSDARVYAALRDGIDFSRFDDTEGMSVTQLGQALRVLTLAEKRLDGWTAAGRRRIVPGRNQK